MKILICIHTHHILIYNVYTSSTKIKLFSIKWNVPFYIDNLTILCYVACLSNAEVVLPGPQSFPSNPFIRNPIFLLDMYTYYMDNTESIELSSYYFYVFEMNPVYYLNIFESSPYRLDVVIIYIASDNKVMQN